MDTNNWNKTIDHAIPYIDGNSLSAKHRSHWLSGRHSNIAIELHAILDGNAIVELDDQTVSLSKGRMLIIFPNTFHACKSITEPFLRFTISFALQDSSSLYDWAESGANHLVFRFDDDFETLFRKILQEYDDEDAYLRDEMLSAEFSELLIRLQRNMKPQNKQGKPRGRMQENIQIIDRYFSGFNFQKDHTRKGLAELMNCSERQLNRILRELCGMSFLEKKQRARMDYVKFLLRNTDLKIPEISSIVGYANEASLYKAFKSASGLSPQEFRKRHRKKST